jgi:hypothetical protein
MSHREGRRGEIAARNFFRANRGKALAELVATQAALRRTTAERCRLEAQHARTDRREWVMHRRERTRHLIELGGLVQKAGLVELADDDRAVLLGALLAVAAKLQSD